MRYLLIVAALPCLLAAPASAQRAERVRCSVNYQADQPCRMVNAVDRGVHRMTFTLGERRIVFVGRNQTGWWAGKLNGKPAMGYERNRGNMVFSTYDLSTSFAWWYPGSEHGTY